MRGFQKPKRLACELETLTQTYGHFHAQPFERGYGTTIGNALRRVLLSSIEGAAITAVKIEGILHEFSSVPGVVEDVTDIIMNLKTVPLRLHVDHPKTLYLESKGPGPVTAGDIKPDPDVEILDPTVQLATVGGDGSLSMEMRVKKGRGYVSSDENFDPDLSLGYIPIDSVHSPVRKVNYYVEAARLGQATDYDRLNLEVWTNGCLTPQDAIARAAKLIKDHMFIFINFEEEPEAEEEHVDAKLDLINENLQKSVEELELSVRSYNCLKNANIRTIGELVVK
ncbi:MAG: DNA-directed RNA polymerase subunit alpha, partial [Acidobacteria bacterium]|nr:DNA-directed RNA polymerase subunit alpha [Acidobacteriota bacterium]